MANIQFFGVSKHYGKVIAVDDVNFTINDGEYISLLGPSGCGKTTTLRMIAGLVLPTKGKIIWDGKQVETIPAMDRDIGYVFQQFAIFPHLSVWDNIAFGPKVKGFSNVDVDATVEEYISLVGLSKKANAFPNDLTAADKQRTGIARVLATGAKTLLLDEPMGALDFKIREHFQDELLRLVKDLGLTAIHVTHDQSEAMAISDRIGVMKKGKMIQLGSPNNLLFNPRKLFTAHFIGESDFLEGVIAKITNNYVTVSLIGDEVLQISTDKIKAINPYIGDRVIVGVRREFFELYDNQSQQNTDANILSGIVVADRFLGEKLRTKIKLKYGKLIEMKRLPNDVRLKMGDKISIRIPENACFLFPYPITGLDQALEVT